MLLSKNKIVINYSETIAWLFEQLPMYQRIGAAAYKADLSNTLKLMEYLKEPQNSFKSVHIAGTNGKGSTSHMLASIFQEAGYKTGLYTSPHLQDFRERIMINGELISKDSVIEFVNKNKTFFETHQLSFFEMTVGLAYDYFREEKVDIAIIEVGLGGRLDSTNVIHPEVSVITNIGLDHTQFLGNTLEEIAFEKAGILKPNTPVVIGETLPETKLVFQKTTKNNNCPITFVEEENVAEYPTDLLGEYQKRNCKTAVKTVAILREKGWDISDEALKNGLLNIVSNTGLLGRWQVLQQNPKVICDTAHNSEGLVLVLDQLRKESFAKLHIVLGVVDDKNLNKILPLFPKGAVYYFCKPDVIRGLKADVLKTKAFQYDLEGLSYSSVKDAYKAALETASEEDLVFIGGSTFVVAEVL